MTKEDRAALREAASKATPGPWVALDEEVADQGMALIADCFQNKYNNARYIALANPAAVLALLARLERCEAALCRFVEETSILPSGAIIGLERGHFDDAQAALEATP